MAYPILTRRTYTTTFEEDHRSIEGSATGSEIIEVMTKNDFANVRKAMLVTEWKRRLPPENVHENNGYSNRRDDWLYQGGGDLTVTLTDFDGSSVLLYERHGTRYEKVMEIHNQYVAQFYDGRQVV